MSPYREYADPAKAEVYRSTEVGAWVVWCGPCDQYLDHEGGPSWAQRPAAQFESWLWAFWVAFGHMSISHGKEGT